MWTSRSGAAAATGARGSATALHMLWINLLNTMLGARGDRPVSEPDLAEIWARSLNDLADMQIEPYQRAWLQLTRPLGLVENTALIATPNEFAKDQLENRLRALITNALSRELGRSIQLAVIIDPEVTAALPLADEQSDPLGIRMPFGMMSDRPSDQAAAIAPSGHPGIAEGGPAHYDGGQYDGGHFDGGRHAGRRDAEAPPRARTPAGRRVASARALRGAAGPPADPAARDPRPRPRHPARRGSREPPRHAGRRPSLTGAAPGRPQARRGRRQRAPSISRSRRL